MPCRWRKGVQRKPGVGQPASSRRDDKGPVSILDPKRERATVNQRSKHLQNAGTHYTMQLDEYCIPLRVVGAHVRWLTASLAASANSLSLTVAPRERQDIWPWNPCNTVCTCDVSFRVYSSLHYYLSKIKFAGQPAYARLVLKHQHLRDLGLKSPSDISPSRNDPQG